ncbi:MAG TPA: tail fiber domain-containing protein, partial [Verrucomicrobiae bacterium]
ASLPVDPDSFMGGPVWLSTSILGSNGPVSLSPSMPITPTPQALYAYSAGVVAGLSPGQAVTSVDGLTDNVNLEPGTGVILETNGNTLTISTQPGTFSDRNMKTAFKPVAPSDTLERLAALPIQKWRYTNETPGIQHLGPMAQDFKAAFGLGNNDKFIDFVDEEGVALSAVQGLNQKVEAENSELRAENANLKRRLDTLEKLILDRKKGE